MKQTLKEVLGSSYGYYFPKTEQDQAEYDAAPPTLRTPPSQPTNERPVTVKVIRRFILPCLDCGGNGPHNPAPGCHDFR